MSTKKIKTGKVLQNGGTTNWKRVKENSIWAVHLERHALAVRINHTNMQMKFVIIASLFSVTSNKVIYIYIYVYIPWYFTKYQEWVRFFVLQSIVLIYFIVSCFENMPSMVSLSHIGTNIFLMFEFTADSQTRRLRSRGVKSRYNFRAIIALVTFIVFPKFGHIFYGLIELKFAHPTMYDHACCTNVNSVLSSP